MSSDECQVKEILVGEGYCEWTLGDLDGGGWWERRERRRGGERHEVMGHINDQCEKLVIDEFTGVADKEVV